jgi:hypothetical protein
MILKQERRCVPRQDIGLNKDPTPSRFIRVAENRFVALN